MKPLNELEKEFEQAMAIHSSFHGMVKAAAALCQEKIDQEKPQWISVEKELPNCTAEQYVSRTGNHILVWSPEDGYEISFICGDPIIWKDGYYPKVTH